MKWEIRTTDSNGNKERNVFNSYKTCWEYACLSPEKILSLKIKKVDELASLKEMAKTNGFNSITDAVTKAKQRLDEIDRLTRGLRDIHSRATGKGGNPKWTPGHLQNLIEGRAHDDWG